MMPSNPADLKKIDTALQTISDSKTRIEAEQEHIKEVVEAIFDDFQLPKKLIRQLAKVWHMRNYAEEVTQQEDFQEAYEALTAVNNKLETI
jgi:cyclopropane fatty-acyl-phospholipid synthase-like methyltransferase